MKNYPLAVPVQGNCGYHRERKRREVTSQIGRFHKIRKNIEAIARWPHLLTFPLGFPKTSVRKNDLYIRVLSAFSRDGLDKTKWQKPGRFKGR
jgi:hypothetical protein